MNDHKENLMKVRAIDLDDHVEEKLKKVVEENEEYVLYVARIETERDALRKEVRNLKKDVKKLKDTVGEVNKATQTAQRVAQRLSADAKEEMVEIMRRDKAYRDALGQMDENRNPPKSKWKNPLSLIPFEAWGIMAGVIIVGMFCWGVVALTLRQNKKMEKIRDTADIHISYYEEIKKWTAEIPDLTKFVRELRVDDKITLNEYAEIREQLHKLRKEKVAREAMGVPNIR